MKNVFRRPQTVIPSSVSCLAALVNQVTHNFKFIKDSLMNIYNELKNGAKSKSRLSIIRNFQMAVSLISRIKDRRIKHMAFLFLTTELKNREPGLEEKLPKLRRNLFTLGLFCKHFSFADLGFPDNTEERILNTFLYYIHQKAVRDDELKARALDGVGFFCATHYKLMLGKQVMTSLLVGFYDKGGGQVTL